MLGPDVAEETRLLSEVCRKSPEWGLVTGTVAASRHPLLILNTSAISQPDVLSTAPGCSLTKQAHLRFSRMPATIPAPETWIRSIGDLRLPPETDRHLQELMDRNNDGLLQPAQKQELAALAAWSEEISLLRAEALQLLGRRPA